MKNFKTIITRTPLRISFFGGGSDIKKFYIKNKGVVISSTINKFIYVTIKKHGTTFDEKYRLNYQKSENVNKIDRIKNNIIRESLKHLNIDEPLYISTIGDIPAMSGLGSSSAFTVGLLKGLFALKNKKINKKNLAELACKIEIDILKSPIGKQDQYAATYGGINKFIFKKNIVKVVPLQKKINSELFFKNLQLFFTGIYRNSYKVLKSINSNSRNQNSIRNIVEKSEIAFKILVKSNKKINLIGKLFKESWNIKKSLSKKITNKTINLSYNKALRAGAVGGKIAGAGGGGFLLFITPKKKLIKVRKSLKNLIHVPIKYESTGSIIIYKD